MAPPPSINIQSTSYGKQEILSLLHKFIIPFWFPECKPGSISGLLNGTWTFSSLHYPDIFPVYGMETGIFPFYGMKPGNLSGLRNKYHGSGNFRFPFRKPEKFRFPFHPEISRNSTLRNKFPNRSSSKMKILFRNNENPNVTRVFNLFENKRKSLIFQ